MAAALATKLLRFLKLSVWSVSQSLYCLFERFELINFFATTENLWDSRFYKSMEKILKQMLFFHWMM